MCPGALKGLRAKTLDFSRGERQLDATHTSTALPWKTFKYGMDPLKGLGHPDFLYFILN
jgi:hypothetical protein